MSTKARERAKGQVGHDAPHGAVHPDQAVRVKRTPKRTSDGTWRPNKPYDSSVGVKVTLRRVHGLTSNRALKVPLRLQSPITGDFLRDHLFNWSTFDTVRAGQRSRPMGAQLLELPITVILLDRVAQESASPGVVAWPYRPNPQRTLAELRFIAGLARGSSPTLFRMVISQSEVWPHPIVNNIFALTRVGATQKDSLGSEYVDLTFLQYRPFEVDRKRRPGKKDRTRIHKLKHGDTLYELAKHYYHRPSAWRLIASSNHISGVHPHSAGDLAKWAKKHHKTAIRIPPAPPYDDENVADRGPTFDEVLDG